MAADQTSPQLNSHSSPMFGGRALSSQLSIKLKGAGSPLISSEAGCSKGLGQSLERCFTKVLPVGNN